MSFAEKHQVAGKVSQMRSEARHFHMVNCSLLSCCFIRMQQYTVGTVKWSLDDFSWQDDMCMSKGISDLQLILATYSDHSILYIYTYIFHGSTEVL